MRWRKGVLCSSTFIFLVLGGEAKVRKRNNTTSRQDLAGEKVRSHKIHNTKKDIYLLMFPLIQSLIH